MKKMILAQDIKVGDEFCGASGYGVVTATEVFKTCVAFNLAYGNGASTVIAVPNCSSIPVVRSSK